MTIIPARDWRFSLIDGDLDFGCTLTLPSVADDQPEPSNGSRFTKQSSGTLKLGSEGKFETIKYEDRSDAGTQRIFKGPSAGHDFGLILTEEEARLTVMAEFSAVSGTLSFGTLNVNANTGVKLGLDGVKFALFGFGATAGYKGVYSLDTPLGSLVAQSSNPSVQAFETYATRA